jgi:hypothetical protein
MMHDLYGSYALSGASCLPIFSDAGQTDPSCKAADPDYVARFNEQCSKTNKQRWVEALSKQSETGKCTTDPVTLKMSCEVNSKCEGGEPTSQVDTVTTRNIVYPCGTDCKGLLLVKCCGTCADNQMKANSGLTPFDKIPTTVQCPGCDKAALDDIVKVNTNKCSVNADGKFSCSISESCQLGEPQVTSTTTERKCNLTPCDVCADADLKAQCCSACLTDVACKGEADPMSRAVCRGCEPGMAIFASPFFFCLLSCLLSAYWGVPCFCRLDTVETGRDSAYLGCKRFVNWSHCRYRGGVCRAILRRHGFAQ